jgi:hypothetical protein
MRILCYLFMQVFRTSPIGAMITWLILYGYFSLDGNGCNLLTNLVVYNDLLQKFVSNSCYFINFYLKQGITLHPKIYQSIFFFYIKSILNYAEKLKLMQIDATTLVYLRRCFNKVHLGPKRQVWFQKLYGVI